MERERPLAGTASPRDGEADRAPGPPNGLRFWLLVAAAALLGSFAAVGYYRGQAGPGYPLDDSWIHLTFARNLASGGGFGANPHEPTPGATSPLWVLLLAPGFLFGDAHAVWPWLLAAICLAAAGGVAAALVVAATERSSRMRASVRWAAALCGITVVWTGPLVWSAAGAMEVPLFVALIGSTLLAHARAGKPGWRRGISWGVLLGLTALARPEGWLLAPILCVATLSRFERSAVFEGVAGTVSAIVVYAPSVIFCLATSGRIFPNTLYAKTTSLFAGAPDLDFLGLAVRWFYQVSPVALFSFVLGAVVVAIAASRRKDVRLSVMTGAFVLGLPFAYAVMGRTSLFVGFAGNFGRYLFPVLPLAIVLGYWAGAWLMTHVTHRSVLPLAVAIMLTALGVTSAGALQGARLYRQNVEDIDNMQVAMAYRLRETLPAGSLVAANDVGALAYFTRFRVLDLIGIISTSTLDALERSGAEPESRTEAYSALLERERPDALVVFPQWFAGVLARLQEHLRAIVVIDRPQNITSGGSRMVAYRVDWPESPHRALSPAGRNPR